MWRVTICAGLVLMCGACSSAHIVRTSEEFGGAGPRWGVVSYPKDEAVEARRLMAEYCRPLSYVVSDYMAGISVVGQPLTRVRFVCSARAADAAATEIQPAGGIR